MLGSFRLLTAQPQGVEIKEFHTNLWFSSSKNLYLDVGLWFDFEQAAFFRNETFTFTLDTPFPIKNNVVHLYDKICNNEILQLLFNEDFKQGTIKVGQNIIHFLEFHIPHKGSFLILKPELARINDNAINIEFKRAGLSKAALIGGKFLQGTDDAQKLGVYIRFRYEVRVFKESNIDITDIGFHKKILIDLRVNDIRTGIPDIATSELVEVNKFMFFIILPSSFEIKASQAYRYGRMLEQKWRSYINYKPGQQLLVYYWRRDELKSNSFNLLVSANQETNTFGALLRALVLIAALAILIYVGDRFELLAILGRVAPIFQKLITWVVWIISLVVGWIIGNALWALLKYAYTTIQPTIAWWVKK